MRRWSPRPLPPTTGHRRPSPPTRRRRRPRRQRAGDGDRGSRPAPIRSGAGVGRTGGSRSRVLSSSSAASSRRSAPPHPCPSLGRRCRRRLPRWRCRAPPRRPAAPREGHPVGSLDIRVDAVVHVRELAVLDRDRLTRAARPASWDRMSSKRTAPANHHPAQLSQQLRADGIARAVHRCGVGVEPGQNPVVAVEDVGDDPTGAVARLGAVVVGPAGSGALGVIGTGRSPGGVGCGSGVVARGAEASPSGRSGSPAPSRTPT